MFRDGAHHGAVAPTTFTAVSIGPGGGGRGFTFCHGQIEMAQNQKFFYVVQFQTMDPLAGGQGKLHLSLEVVPD
jgi:hypothetical protein